MSGVDLIGIWASGDVFVGNTNSAGKKIGFPLKHSRLIIH